MQESDPGILARAPAALLPTGSARPGSGPLRSSLAACFTLCVLCCPGRSTSEAAGPLILLEPCLLLPSQVPKADDAAGRRALRRLQEVSALPCFAAILECGGGCGKRWWGLWPHPLLPLWRRLRKGWGASPCLA